MVARDTNGDHPPPLDVVRDPPAIPAVFRSEGERALYRLYHGLGTTMTHGFAGVRSEMQEGFKMLRAGLGLELDSRLGPAKSLPPPTPRAESPSTHEIEERLDARMVESFERKAQETPGPMLAGTPHELAQLAKEAATIVLLEERERLKNEANARIANEVNESRAKWRTLLRWGLPSAFLVALAGALGTCAVAEAQHQRGILEERARVSTTPARP